MSESAAAGGNGEGNQHAAGSPADSSAVTQSAPGPDLAAQLAQTESRRRELQSQLDRQRQENQQMQDRFAELESRIAGIDPDKISDTMFARFAQHQAVADARATLKDEFPLARESVLKGQFQTPEELRAAVEASHKAEEEHRTAIRSEVYDSIVADLQAKGVTVPVDAQTQTNQTDTGAAAAASTGQLTVAQFQAMSFQERMQVDPAELDRLSRENV